ncbi:hypothetical protein M513_13124, partial [Trichuris suis]
RPGVVYEIKCDCNASYIGETGNTLFHRFDQHMKNVLTYKNAERRLNGEPTIGPGRPPKIEPRKAMANAIKASVVVEHASQCSLDPRPKIICRESLFHLQRIKEALYIKSNSTIHRDNGVAFSETHSKTGQSRESKINYEFICQYYPFCRTLVPDPPSLPVPSVAPLGNCSKSNRGSHISGQYCVTCHIDMSCQLWQYKAVLVKNRTMYTSERRPLERRRAFVVDIRFPQYHNCGRCHRPMNANRFTTSTKPNLEGRGKCHWISCIVIILDDGQLIHHSIRALNSPSRFDLSGPYPIVRSTDATPDYRQNWQRGKL